MTPPAGSTFDRSMPTTTVRISRTALRSRRVLRITAGWIAVGIVAAFVETAVLREYGVPVGVADELGQHVWRALLGGLLGGGIYIFLLRDRLRHLAYLPAVGIMATLVLIALAGARTAWNVLADPPRPNDILSLAFLGQYLYWALLMAATMLAVRLTDQYGSGALNYLAGRYDKPHQELRIFMFLDMRSSTAIAEKLGHVRYFELLNDVYADITDPLVYTGGEVYQYVGDEVSVSWPLRKGLKDHRCIRCFFGIQSKLSERAEHYRQRFGLVPQFKAGFHYGEVTTGEVGLVKKERIFSGDVVNTAARIQNSCNTYGVEILLSKDLLDVLRLPERLYEARHIGEIALRGKREEVSLWTLVPVERTVGAKRLPAGAGAQ